MFYFSPFSPFAFSQHFFTFSGFTRNQGDSQEVPIYRVKYYRYECIYMLIFIDKVWGSYLAFIHQISTSLESNDVNIRIRIYQVTYKK